MSSVITISQPPSNPGDKDRQESPAITFTPMDPEPEDAFDSDAGSKTESGGAPASESEGSDAELIGLDETDNEPVSNEVKTKARVQSLDKLQSGGTAPTRKGKNMNLRRYFKGSEEGGLAPKMIYQPAQATIRRRAKANGPDAVIVLKEERVSIHHQRTYRNHCMIISRAGEYISRFPEICVSAVSLLFTSNYSVSMYYLY